MMLVAAVTSASLDPTNVIKDAEWIPSEFPMNFHVDPRVRRQVQSTDVTQVSPVSTDVKVIDGTTLLKALEPVQVFVYSFAQYLLYF